MSGAFIVVAPSLAAELADTTTTARARHASSLPLLASCMVITACRLSHIQQGTYHFQTVQWRYAE
jgi:hypothetical protein